MRRPGQIPWRDTARMPALFGLDARVLAILVLPIMVPVGRIWLLAACGLIGLFFIVAGTWWRLSPEVALLRARCWLAGRRQAVLPRHRPVAVRWSGAD